MKTETIGITTTERDNGRKGGDDEENNKEEGNKNTEGGRDGRDGRDGRSGRGVYVARFCAVDPSMKSSMLAWNKHISSGLESFFHVFNFLTLTANFDFLVVPVVLLFCHVLLHCVIPTVLYKQ
jgi:hypothetical protein